MTCPQCGVEIESGVEIGGRTWCAQKCWWNMMHPQDPEEAKRIAGITKVVVEILKDYGPESAEEVAVRIVDYVRSMKNA